MCEELLRDAGDGLHHADSNEDYTMLGGVYVSDCGPFAISGIKN